MVILSAYNVVFYFGCVCWGAGDVEKKKNINRCSSLAEKKNFNKKSR